MKEVIERLKEKSSECAFPFVSAETFSMGMSLRDYFAAAALQGLLANPKLDREIMRNGGARGGWIEASAYGFANAMMVERQDYLKKEDN